MGSFAPDERHVLLFFMYVHGGARSGPAGCSMICLPGVSCVSLNLMSDASIAVIDMFDVPGVRSLKRLYLHLSTSRNGERGAK